MSANLEKNNTYAITFQLEPSGLVEWTLFWESVWVLVLPMPHSNYVTLIEVTEIEKQNPSLKSEVKYRYREKVLLQQPDFNWYKIFKGKFVFYIYFFIFYFRILGQKAVFKKQVYWGVIDI